MFLACRCLCCGGCVWPVLRAIHYSKGPGFREKHPCNGRRWTGGGGGEGREWFVSIKHPSFCLCIHLCVLSKWFVMSNTLTLLCFCIEDDVATASVSTHNSTRGLKPTDFTSQVLPSPTVDFKGQALTASSSASTRSATVKKEWDFTAQALPTEQASLVRKTESLSLGSSHTRSRNVSDEADVTRRTSELVAWICLHHWPYCNCLPCANCHTGAYGCCAVATVEMGWPYKTTMYIHFNVIIMSAWYTE